MRYAIVGTGALGGYYGGLLARSGHDIHFLCHRDADFIKTNGIKVESCRGDFHLGNVKAYSSTQEMPVCDIVIICIKSTQNHLLTELLPPLIGLETQVVVLQNGLDVEEPAEEIVGKGRVFGGCCFLCSNKVGPGHIRHLDYGRIAMGAYRGKEGMGPRGDERTLNAIATDFMNAGIEISVVENLAEARWRKLMWNVPFNGLSVILNASTSALMNNTYGQQLSESLMREVRDIGLQLGLPIEEEFVRKLMQDTERMVPYDSSMRLDYLAGRPMEIEAIFGNAIRAADRVGAACDQLRFLYRQLAFLNQRQSKPLID